MKVKLGELINCSGSRRTEDGGIAVVGLSKILLQDLPFKIQYRFIRLLEAADSELKRFQTLQRKMFDKWGELEKVPVLNEDGTPKIDENNEPVMKDTGNMHIKPENFQEYNKEINELLNEEVEVWYEPIPIEELDDVKLNKMDYDMIKPFLLDKSDAVLKIVK